MNAALERPMKKRKIKAMRYSFVCAKVANDNPHSNPKNIKIFPLLELFPNAANPNVPTVAPNPIDVSKYPNPSAFIPKTSFAQAGINTKYGNPNITERNINMNRGRNCTLEKAYLIPALRSLIKDCDF